MYVPTNNAYNDKLPPGFWIGLILLTVILIYRNCS